MYIAPKGKTHNLMDYTTNATATNLRKYQWDYIHNPENIVGVFEDDSEGGSKIFKSNLSLVYYKDSGLVHNQTIYFLPEINEEITLRAKQTKNDIQENVKVNWSYQKQKGLTEITFTTNPDFFGDKEYIQIDVTEKVLLGADSTLTYFIGKVNVSPDLIIDSILSNIKNIREEFDSLTQVVSELQADNYDAISLLAISKYITQGLSDFYESPPNELLTNLDKTLARMYNLDLLIKDIENFDDLASEISSIYSQESGKREFFNSIIDNLKTINPLDTKGNLQKLYKEQIINSTFEKLEGRLNNE